MHRKDNQVLRIENVVPQQVFQRGDDGQAQIPVRATGDAARVEVRLAGGQWRPLERQGDSFIGRVPAVTGGPYTLEARARDEAGEVTDTLRLPGLLVGDLWITAGQSNMDGVGQLSEAEPPSRLVHAFYYDDRWAVAREPLCWYNEAADSVHWGVADPVLRAQAIRYDRDFRTYGAGPGVAFGKALVAATGVPVGLVVCSHGGTSMDQWSPALRGEGGKSLYGSMMRRVAAVGGRVKGVIWYQGESDAFDDMARSYRGKMRAFVADLRRDLQDPHLPFAYVQIGPFFGGDPNAAWAWDMVQREQLDLEPELGNAGLVTAVGMSLADAIHLDSRSQRRLGRLLARIALRLAFGRNHESFGPRPAGAKLLADGKTVEVQYREVNGRLLPRGPIWGFSVEDGGRPVPLAACRVPADRPDRVRLTLRRPKNGGELLLWYGRGHNPVVNLHDANGWPAPAFGPMPISS